MPSMNCRVKLRVAAIHQVKSHHFTRLAVHLARIGTGLVGEQAAPDSLEGQ
jgi:hypothetical protein